MLLELLATSDTPLAAFSGYGLAIESPAIVEIDRQDAARLADALARRYAKAATFEHFGQAHTALRIYRRKDAE